MKYNFRKLALLSLCFVFVFFACKKDKSNQQNNWVTVRLPAEPDRLNPILSTSGYASQVESHIFMPLLQFDPESLELAPFLAKERPVVKEILSGEFKGGFSYTFEIREEARWDDGKPVLASDYIFTFKAILNPKVAAPAYRAYFNFIKDIQVDPENPKRFTIYTNGPYILAEAALGNVEVYPEHFYDPKGIMKNYSIKLLSNQVSGNELAESDTLLTKFADIFNDSEYSRAKEKINGCGAYQFEEWISGERIVLSKKKDWWGDQLADDVPLLKALPSKIIYQPIPDATTAITLLKSQEIDAMGSIKAESFVELADNEFVTNNYNLSTPPYLAYYYIGCNSNSLKLASRDARRAIAHLLDIDQLIESVMYGMAQPIVGPIHPTKTYYHKNLEPISFDLEKAASLLFESGWSDSDGDGWLDKMIDNEKVVFKLSYKYSSGNDIAKNIGLLLKENAQKVGIQIDIIGKEFSELVSDTRKRDFDLYYLAWSNPPTLDDLRQTWHTQSDTPKGSNKVGFGNAESDAIIDSLRVEMDEQKRNELYLKIQEIIYEDQPYIFLFSPKERIAIHKRFEAETSARRPGFFENYFELTQNEAAGY